MFETHTESKIIEVDLALSHDRARRNNNRGAWDRRLDFRQNELHEKEVGEIIDAKLHLESLLGSGEGTGHHTSNQDHMVNLGHICQAHLNCMTDVAETS